MGHDCLQKKISLFFWAAAGGFFLACPNFDVAATHYSSFFFLLDLDFCITPHTRETLSLALLRPVPSWPVAVVAFSCIAVFPGHGEYFSEPRGHFHSLGLIRSPRVAPSLISDRDDSVLGPFARSHSRWGRASLISHRRAQGLFPPPSPPATWISAATPPYSVLLYYFLATFPHRHHSFVLPARLPP